MTACDKIRPLLSAFVDGELTTVETKETEMHLRVCDACRQEWESLADVDSRLTNALVIDDVNGKSAAILQRVELPTRRIDNRRHRWPWLSIAATIAAILLLAWLPTVFFEKHESPVDDSAPEVIARMVRATGPVLLLSPNESEWMTLTPNSNESFPAGARLKTGDEVLCEIQTSAKGLIRLNGSAEVVFLGANQVELVSGQLWCLASESTSIDVDIPVANIPTPQKAIFTCPSSLELQCVSSEKFASCNSVSSEKENVKMTMGSFACEVAPGETVSIDREQKIDRRVIADSTAKVWQLPLLAIGNNVDRELVVLLDRLLSPIGMTKAMHMNEEQIRKLGPSGTIPLLAYAATESSPEHLQLRQTAIRLASDLADERGVRLLKTLTSDPDAYISSVAKKTLNRLVSMPNQ